MPNAWPANSACRWSKRSASRPPAAGADQGARWVAMPADARGTRAAWRTPDGGGHRARSSRGAQDSWAWWAATGSTASPSATGSTPSCCIRCSGPLILAVILFLVFQAVFAWAQVPMDAIKPGVVRIRRLAGRGAAGQPAEGFARQRRARRRRQRLGVPAADHHPVLLHFGARRFGLPAARRILARPGDGQRGVVGPRIHSLVVELRLRDSRNHGDAHHPKSARSAGDDHDCAADDLFGAPAGLRAHHRRVHPAANGVGRLAIAGRGAVRAVHRGGRERHGGGLCAQAQRLRARASSR